MRAQAATKVQEIKFIVSVNKVGNGKTQTAKKK